MKRRMIVVFAVLGVAIAGECAWWWRLRAMTGANERARDRAAAEWKALGDADAPRSREYAGQLSADVEAARQSLDALRRTVRGGAVGRALRSAEAPATRAEAYFDLASFVERMESRAREHDVEVRPEAARFGFATYARGGPDEAHVKTVFEDRQVVEYLCETLFAARPIALLSVKRERLSEGASAEERRGAARMRASGAGDFFALDRAASLGRVEGIETRAFQVDFVGETATLRAFLNRLAAFEVPVAVRVVDVAPAEDDEGLAPARPRVTGPRGAASFVLTEDATLPDGGAFAIGNERVPLVAQRYSRFRVTVEYLKLGDEDELADPGPDFEGTGDVWPAPVSQSRGPGWRYEAFTPPEIFFDAALGRFEVRPPDALASERVAEAFGLELMGVTHEPFRLQLVGYVGEAGGWRGMFQEVATGEIAVAGEGHRFAALELEILGIDVRVEAVTFPESMPVAQRVALAVVRDRRTGRDVVLTQRERRAGEGMVATVEFADGSRREVREADAFSHGTATYRVERIVAVPPQVEVTKTTADVAPERRVLGLRMEFAATSAAATNP